MRYLFIFILILVVSITAEYSPAMNQNDLIDNFVLTISSRYDIEVPKSFFNKPMHKADFMEFLAASDSLDKAGVLTPNESYLLEKITERVTNNSIRFKWGNESKNIHNYLNLSLHGRIKPSYDDSVAIYTKGTINPMLSGNIGRLSYFSDVKVWTELQSDTVYKGSDYQPYNGLNYNLYKRKKEADVRSSDILRGGISYSGSRVDLETAVDYLREGPAVYFPLTFSGNYAPITYGRFAMNLAGVAYSQTFGLLKTQKDKKKYLYSHRIEGNLFKKKLTIALNEVIVNGSSADKAQEDSIPQRVRGEERSVEWLYLIPFLPYTFAEHYNGDRDNKLLSFDANLVLPTNFRWYFELLLDDISNPLELFISNDSGNKWALTVGLQYFGILAGRNLTATLEYSHIEPWVYTHFFGGSHRYTNYGHSIGSDLGPNSAALILSTKYKITPKNEILLSIENIRKNERVRGGKITDVFHLSGDFPNSPDSQTKEFLGNNSTSLTTFSLGWNLNPLGRFNLNTLFIVNNKQKISIDLSGEFYF